MATTTTASKAAKHQPKTGCGKAFATAPIAMCAFSVLVAKVPWLCLVDLPRRVSFDSIAISVDGDASERIKVVEISRNHNRSRLRFVPAVVMAITRSTFKVTVATRNTHTAT